MNDMTDPAFAAPASRLERIGSVLGRWIESLGKVLNAGACSSVFVLMLLVAVDVFMRYLFGRPLLFSYDLVGLMLVPIAFLGLAWTMKMEGHVHVGILVDRLGTRARALSYFFTSLLALPFFLLLIWQSWVRAWLAFERGHTSAGFYEIPWFPFMVMIPLGCLALSLQMVVRMVRLLRTAIRCNPE